LKPLQSEQLVFLSNLLISELEEEYNRHCRNEVREHNLSMAIAHYESQE
jgi:hypothetical protein